MRWRRSNPKLVEAAKFLGSIMTVLFVLALSLLFVAWLSGNFHTSIQEHPSVSGVLSPAGGGANNTRNQGAVVVWPSVPPSFPISLLIGARDLVVGNLR